MGHGGCSDLESSKDFVTLTALRFLSHRYPRIGMDRICSLDRKCHVPILLNGRGPEL